MYPSSQAEYTRAIHPYHWVYKILHNGRRPYSQDDREIIGCRLSESILYKEAQNLSRGSKTWIQSGNTLDDIDFLLN